MSVLEDARALLATGPLCHSCLGRPFADRSFGLSNVERGKALRVAAALEDDEDLERPDPDACWVCEGHCADYDNWAERVAEAAEGHEFDTYQVGTRVPPLIEENDRLLRADASMDEDAGELFKSAFNREVGKRVGALTDSEVDFERPDVLALLNLERGDVDLQVNPAFVYGRYRKVERDIPQTEWPCRECGGSGKQFGDGGEIDCDHCDGTGYMYPTSVEQEVAPHVREAMDGDEALFHGAGREDVDALMLGSGRPFVVEIKHPRARKPDVETLQNRINDAAEGRVEVEGLRLATHEIVERVKELDASKTYRAAVEFDEPVAADDLEAALAELEGTTVEQYTPNRVDHRRASKTRTRTVYAIDGHLDSTEDAEDSGSDCDLPSGSTDATTESTDATIEIHGEGGLYVKELISGDEGRTEPSLAGLLETGAEVTALDVLDVEGEDESFADPEYFVE